MILDTSFLVDLMNGHERALEEARTLEETDRTQRIPAIVLYELYVGVGRVDLPREKVRKIERVTESRAVEAVTPHLSKIGGRIDGQLRRDGNRVASHDVLIGATARHYDEAVVTGNPTDFDDLPDVSVRTYRD